MSATQITNSSEGYMLVHKDFSEPVATILNTLTEKELKQRILTANGLTIAQEEAIQALDPNDTTEAMSPEEAIAFLKQQRNED